MDVEISYLSASSWDETIWDRLHWLQENEPVYWSEADGLWVLTRYEDVAYASKNQHGVDTVSSTGPHSVTLTQTFDFDWEKATARKLAGNHVGKYVPDIFSRIYPYIRPYDFNRLLPCKRPGATLPPISL